MWSLADDGAAVPVSRLAIKLMIQVLSRVIIRLYLSGNLACAVEQHASGLVTPQNMPHAQQMALRHNAASGACRPGWMDYLDR